MIRSTDFVIQPTVNYVNRSKTVRIFANFATSLCSNQHPRNNCDASYQELYVNRNRYEHVDIQCPSGDRHCHGCCVSDGHINDDLTDADSHCFYVFDSLLDHNSPRHVHSRITCWFHSGLEHPSWQCG